MHKYTIIRADASNEIGTGHIMRCLVLADELKQNHLETVFVCRNLPGNLSDYINQRGYRVFSRYTHPLSPDDMEKDASYTIQVIHNIGRLPEWTIIDHYAIGEKWELLVRAHTCKILVIDDLANRRHHADILLDQNLAENAELRYMGLVPESCRLLLGPSYLLLRPIFLNERRNLRQRTGEIRRLLVFFGGSDSTNETEKALDALIRLRPNIEVDVIVGQTYEYRAGIQQKCLLLGRANLHIQVENMANFIASADFALGAGGISMWERCYLGLPSAITIVADNQKDSVCLAERLGAVWKTGYHNEINSSHYADILYRAMNSPEQLVRMSSRSLDLVGSSPESITSRVVEVMMME
ncbi:UDP-2,4-diacetamido-2,4,6-trideoxy-beta-L-altropyranose hydrolase [Paenibacillus forsythiae]|uniref:UDP-2,4-diacetamido-2,4, 6-trideoxy-beta-L-altropyranose hydrolase n=1 Tax=Paenibacillus forsythiae TaxID=365616 RepID=A0ABU3HB05_9BACL|nr:UDP-2,4-diacetamido-2,4,6-trideoxy-beta-L-altropyranose hydrolase [Paenibacillus forsythiae]MDT3427990.1 UDP-2,4-diacetamido-2,4,6-trideoxy-beta-L-altropyranose hydrolase [Paenibacillus forsythiae]